jgi:hypothetical protein
MSLSDLTAVRALERDSEFQSFHRPRDGTPQGLKHLFGQGPDFGFRGIAASSIASGEPWGAASRNVRFAPIADIPCAFTEPCPALRA